MLPRLTPATALDFLQAHHLLDGVPAERVSVAEMTRRNVNFAVSVDGRPAWFVKQMQYATREVAESLRREARCYQIAQETPSLVRLRTLMPRCVLFDDEHFILVLECLDGVNAADADARVGTLDERVAELLGHQLAHLHEAREVLLRSALRALLPGELPWVLQERRQRNPRGQRAAFLSGVEMDAALARELSALRESWRRDAMIHGDTRLENFVLCRSTSLQDGRDTCLVDWELADIGDAAWDCAGVMQHYWTEWITASPPYHERWEALRRVIDRFWAAYTAKWEDSPRDAAAAFRCATRMTGARLVQTAYEHWARYGKRTPVVDRCAHAARLMLTETDAALEGFVTEPHAA